MPTLAHRLLERAKKQDGAVAIFHGSEAIGYYELGVRATQLAERLMPFVQDKAPIAVASSQTSEMVTAALAAWILGCPYVPLDPLAPVHRLEHMLRDSRASVLVTGARETRAFPTGPWGVIAQEGVTGTTAGGFIAEPKTLSEDAAYVIYTSGSTGLAKGVAVSHRSLSHFAAWYGNAFASAPTDRATQFASLTFDASVFEIWTTLFAGASLWPLAPAAALDEAELRNFIVSNEITHCFAPTAIAEELLGLVWPAHTKLRYLLTGADTLRRFPPAGLPFKLINNYGPTECTVLATSGAVPSESGLSELPSIGRPISGAAIYLLDEQLQPVAADETGEIFIGGAGVALGYIGHAARLTEERFLPDPNFVGQRMYRTGDRGRWRPDGELEFAGRLDSQLKIRGYRVEPDEIVQKLRGHQSVHVCAVKALGQGPATQLAVYLELNEPVTSDELRDYLADHLPAFMIPDVFLRVDKLPLSERGKVDMTALPGLESAERLPARLEEAAEAQNEIETELATMIAHLLKRPSVKTTDNFFRLGGHSLLAAQVIARVRQYFGVDLPIRAIFEAPTVQALAAAVENRILAALTEMPPAAAGKEPLKV